MNKAKWEDLQRELGDADDANLKGVVTNVVSDIETLGSPAQKARVAEIRARVGDIDEDADTPRWWRNNLMGEMVNPGSPLHVERQQIQGAADGGPGGGRRRRHHKKTRKHRGSKRKTHRRHRA